MTVQSEWRVDDIPPAPEGDPGAEGGAGAPGGPAPSAPAAAIAIDWLPEDVARLKRWINLPYQKLAQATGDAYLQLSDLEQTAIAMPTTAWMPVEWVRDAAGQRIPPVVGVALSIAALSGVTLMKVLEWNRQHPDAYIAIPFVTKKGAQRAGSNARPSTAPGAAAAGSGRPERSSGGGDQRQDGGAAEPPPPAGSVDGGPPADSIDDIRRGYGT